MFQKFCLEVILGIWGRYYNHYFWPKVNDTQLLTSSIQTIKEVIILLLICKILCPEITLDIQTIERTTKMLLRMAYVHVMIVAKNGHISRDLINI